jgi:Uma2 family endonuclease
MNRVMRRQGFDYMDLDDFEELLADKPAHEKWELIGGRVVRMMVGARWQHNVITGNIADALRRQIRGRGAGCQVFTETFWLKERFMDLAVFPDIMVRCGPRLPQDATSINDPIVLIEVVSPGSEARDRVEKDGLYRRLPTLMHYVLVERDVAVVDVLDRIDDGWNLRKLEGAEAVLELPSLTASMSLAEVYRDVLA